MKTLIIALGLSFIANFAIAAEDVICTVTCTNPATKTSKQHTCIYPMPPGVSFSLDDCKTQCRQSCINSFGINSPGGGKIPGKK